MMGSYQALAQKAPKAKGSKPPSLQLPVDCKLGSSCWVFNYVDLNPKKRSSRDYACGPMASDGHRGTDFALRDEAAIKSGVTVRAAAAGTVSFVRDGMADADFRKVDPKTIAKRACGNMVQLNHDGDWKTRYCHLRNGSVPVKKGQKIAAGAKIGEIGFSGRAAYPQVEFRVFQGNNKFADPFRGVSGGAKCGMGKKPLWDAKAQKWFSYDPVLLYSTGFASRRPFVKSVRGGIAALNKISKLSLKLFYYVDIRNLRKGDAIVFKITAPDGKVLKEGKKAVKKSQFLSLQVMDVTSRGSWPPGTYRGELALTRKSRAGAKTFRTATDINVQ